MPVHGHVVVAVTTRIASDDVLLLTGGGVRIRTAELHHRRSRETEHRRVGRAFGRARRRCARAGLDMIIGAAHTMPPATAAFFSASRRSKPPRSTVSLVCSLMTPLPLAGEASSVCPRPYTHRVQRSRSSPRLQPWASAGCEQLDTRAERRSPVHYLDPTTTQARRLEGHPAIPANAQLNGRYEAVSEERLASTFRALSTGRSGPVRLQQTPRARRTVIVFEWGEDGEHVALGAESDRARGPDGRPGSRAPRRCRTATRRVRPVRAVSHREGQPRVAIEAAASGLSAVATEIRSCGDVALVAAIERLVGAPEQDAAMSAASAAKARREFESAMSWPV